MKNYSLIILFAFLLISFNISAQTDQGSFLLGAGTSLQNTSLKVDDIDPGSLSGIDISSNQLDVKLNGGYFVADGLMLGLTIVYDVESETTDGNGYEQTLTTTSTAVGPVLRYYFAGSGAFAGVSYAVGSINYLDEESGYEDYETKQSISALGIGAGYSFFVNDIVAFTPSVTYVMSKSTLEDAYYNGNTGFYEDQEIESSGLILGFGINIHFDSY